MGRRGKKHRHLAWRWHKLGRRGELSARSLPAFSCSATPAAPALGRAKGRWRIALEGGAVIGQSRSVHWGIREMQEPGEIQIGFLLDAWLQGVMFNPAKAEGLSFEIKGPNDLVLSVRPMHPDDDAFGDRRGITCKIRGVFSATQDQSDFVAAL